MKWLKRVAVLCTVALLGTVVTAQPASADTFLDLWANVNNPNACLLMQVGHNASLWNCAQYADQEWILNGPGNHYLMQNYASGYCLGVNSLSNNAAVGPVQCDLNDLRSQWNIYHVDGLEGFRIQSWYSGKCLLGSGGQINVAVTQYTCMNYNDQMWYQLHF